MTLTVPNLLSLVRMGLLPLFVIAILEGAALRALVLFAVAGLTDLADGLTARHLRQESLLGAWLDPLADKLLLTSAYVFLALPGDHAGVTIPAWVTVLVIARDVIIVGLALVLHLATGVRRFSPTVLSKVNTALQIGGAVAVLASRVEPAITGVAAALVLAVAASTVASGLHYLYWLASRPKEAVEQAPPG